MSRPFKKHLLAMEGNLPRKSGGQFFTATNNEPTNRWQKKVSAAKTETVKEP